LKVVLRAATSPRAFFCLFNPSHVSESIRWPMRLSSGDPNILQTKHLRSPGSLPHGVGSASRETGPAQPFLTPAPRDMPLATEPEIPPIGRLPLQPGWPPPILLG
jgi:hypothetical protein